MCCEKKNRAKIRGQYLHLLSEVTVQSKGREDVEVYEFENIQHSFEEWGKRNVAIEADIHTNYIEQKKMEQKKRE